MTIIRKADRSLASAVTAVAKPPTKYDQMALGSEAIAENAVAESHLADAAEPKKNVFECDTVPVANPVSNDSRISLA